MPEHDTDLPYPRHSPLHQLDLLFPCLGIPAPFCRNSQYPRMRFLPCHVAGILPRERADTLRHPCPDDLRPRMQVPVDVRGRRLFGNRLHRRDRQSGVSPVPRRLPRLQELRPGLRRPLAGEVRLQWQEAVPEHRAHGRARREHGPEAPQDQVLRAQRVFPAVHVQDAGRHEVHDAELGRTGHSRGGYGAFLGEVPSRRLTHPLFFYVNGVIPTVRRRRGTGGFHDQVKVRYRRGCEGRGDVDPRIQVRRRRRIRPRGREGLLQAQVHPQRAHRGLRRGRRRAVRRRSRRHDKVRGRRVRHRQDARWPGRCSRTNRGHQGPGGCGRSSNRRRDQGVHRASLQGPQVRHGLGLRRHRVQDHPRRRRLQALLRPCQLLSVRDGGRFTPISCTARGRCRPGPGTFRPLCRLCPRRSWAWGRTRGWRRRS